MKKTALIWIAVLALALVAVPFFSALAQDKLPPPLDPQSWVLQRDMTWEDYRPNPVIDWMAELNPAGIQKPSTVQNATAKTPIKGGLVMIEYLDRKFISRGAPGSDPLGFHMYKEDGTGMRDDISNNPITDAYGMIADAKYNGDRSKVTDADFGQWWADYLNKPQEINNFATIDEYYREASYGKWAVDLTPYGPFTIPYFEFETMGYDQSSSFQTYRDVPPSFRPGTNGTSNSSQFDSIAIPFARDSGVPFRDLDFFFMLHAGYDESGVWQQFGMFQFPNRASVPYALGPGPRMLKVEQFFTENPSYLTTYATRYNNTPSGAFWRGERDKYAAMVTAGTAANYEFKLQQADWDWVNGYNSQTQRNTRYVAFTCWEAAVGEWSHMSTASAANTGAGRSIRYSTQGENDGMGTFAHEFGHIGDWPDNYQLQWTINNSPLTEPWEIMSRGQLGGPFDYHTRWQVPNVQGGTVPTNPSMRNKIVAKYYDAATANPSNTIPANGATANDILEMRVQDLAASTPLVAEVVARNIPLNNKGYYPQLEQYGLVGPNFYKGIHLTFATGSTSAYRDRAPRVQTGWTWTYTAQATWMGVEVVDMNGYDSFAPDHGVLLSRHANESTGTGNSYTWNIIDSHLYDISMVDYMVPGLNGAPDDYVAHALGSPYQLWDAAFHAGKSSVDTGYYMSEYDPADPHYNDPTPRKLNTSTYDLEWKKAMIKPGSIQRWEPRNGREIASGDTVNEWHDPYNDLHFYILSPNWHDGRTLPGKSEPEQFLSYTIGIRHGAGTPVGGDLNVGVGQVEKETPGRVAVANYTIKNTGNATDIIRVGVTGELDPLLLNDLYAVGAGETITVPIYVDLPVDIRTKNMGGKLITVSASSETNSAKLGSASVPIEELIAYNYNVYLKPAKSELFVGETLLVDVMLAGDINYTSFTADVTYDPALLKCDGYSNMSGFVTACSPTAPNTIGIRCIPSTNMVLGASCDPEVRVVTLKFTVLNTFPGETAATALTFSTITVNPPAGYLFTGMPSGKPAPLDIYRVGDDSLQGNLAKYPGLFDTGTGTTAPAWTYDTSNVKNIVEEVYVEVPCDTDGDGQRDLIRLWIRRPLQSAEPGIRVPVIYEQSPYREQTNPLVNHNVNDPLQINADTTADTYTDILSGKKRAADWYWGNDAKLSAQDKVWYGPYGIPAARTPLGVSVNGAGGAFNGGTWTTTGRYTWYDYFVPRGYAIILGSSIGNKFSDGFTNCGDVEETLCAMATIKWLNGEVKGYTDQSGLVEVDATTWSNGNVALLGQSYNGTIPIGTACSGVEGLKAILPVAGISSWYDYYRENGGVIAANNFQGEDADILAIDCDSRRINLRTTGTYSGSNPPYAPETAVPSWQAYYTAASQPFSVLRQRYEDYLTQMRIDMDRDTGDYNSFWDDRNYLATVDRVNCGILLSHGFNDFNVKPKQMDQFYQGVKEKTNAPIKLMLHRDGHGQIWDHEQPKFFEYAHKWFDHFLYGIENGIVEEMPEVSLADNLTGNFEFFDAWPVPGSTLKKYYLDPTGVGAAGSFNLSAPAVSTATVKDSLLSWTGANLSTAAITTWETRIINYANLTAPNAERLIFLSDISETFDAAAGKGVRFSGTIRLALEAASDKPYGHISAYLVDLGPDRRAFAKQNKSVVPAAAGASSYQLVDYNPAMAATMSDYKIICTGHADIQNPNPAKKIYKDAAATSFIPGYYYQTKAITPGEYNQYYFEFEPNDYKFKAGNKMGIVVFTTDYRNTPTPADTPTLTIKYGENTYVEIPSIGVFNTITAPAPLPELIQEIAEIVESVEPGDIVQIDVNSGDALEIEIVK